MEERRKERKKERKKEVLEDSQTRAIWTGRENGRGVSYGTDG